MNDKNNNVAKLLLTGFFIILLYDAHCFRQYIDK